MDWVTFLFPATWNLWSQNACNMSLTAAGFGNKINTGLLATAYT